MHDQSLLRRFWAKVDKDGSVPEYAPHLGPCWVWTASRDTKGYGKIWKTGKQGMWIAHRLSYDIANGLPDDSELVLDHLCRVRHCVNPAHLEPVTQRENTLRGEAPPAYEIYRTHCPYGHEYSEANTYRWAGQPEQRKCATCRATRSKQRRIDAQTAEYIEARIAELRSKIPTVDAKSRAGVLGAITKWSRHLEAAKAA